MVGISVDFSKEEDKFITPHHCFSYKHMNTPHPKMVQGSSLRSEPLHAHSQGSVLLETQNFVSLQHAVYML